MVIGLVGKSCAGKDVAAARYSQRGVACIDVDALGHESLVVNRGAVAQAFGPSVLNEDGSVNRKALGALVFADAGRLEVLNGISHPWMRSRVEDFIRNRDLCMINCALLEEMDLVPLCDEILFFWAPFEQRMERALKRDGITQEAFRQRDSSQKDIGSTLFECGRRVITIINDRDLEYLYRQLDFYYDTLQTRGYVYG